MSQSQETEERFSIAHQGVRVQDLAVEKYEVHQRRQAMDVYIYTTRTMLAILIVSIPP